MSTITVYRGIPYTETVSAPTRAGNSNIRVVWSWRRNSRSADWNISKSHAISVQAATITLTSAETSSLPFSGGYRDIFYVHDNTGLYTWLQSDSVTVSEMVGGGNASGASGYYLTLGFNTFGTAATGDALVGSHTATAAGTIKQVELACQTAPLGASLTATLWLDGVATSNTFSITAGTTSNTVDTNIAVGAAQVITLKWSSTGTSPNEGSNVNVGLNYQFT